MSASWLNLPMPKLQRVEMWCARHWIEAREAGLVALSAGDGTYLYWRALEHEWFAALLVVNRVTLGIEPMRGETFLDGSSLKDYGISTGTWSQDRRTLPPEG